MSSQVFFHSARSSAKQNRLSKVSELFKKADFSSLIGRGDRVAVKVHWGEPGNVGFVPVPYVRVIVDLIKQAGGVPFVTDTNTLYTGRRRDAVQNLEAAASNGYTPLSLGAPLIVADGLKGRDAREVAIEGTLCQSAKIASGIADADAMIVVSHVKGHMLFGYAGAIKNLGMGCSTPAGKQHLHSDIRPEVDVESCHGDGICVKRCPERCIEMVERQGASPGGQASPKVARIDTARCVGCGECTTTCPHSAIPIRWESSAESLLMRTAEYAWASVKDKPGKVGYLNLIIQVNPDCDCCDWNDNPVVADVGFASSVDPVALDVACADLVKSAPVLPSSKLEQYKGNDVWRGICDVPYRRIFAHAQKMGLGRQEYELIKL